LFQRHGISRLEEARDKSTQSKFKSYAIGYVHIDIAEVRTIEANSTYSWAPGRRLPPANPSADRTSKLVFVRLETKATRMIACPFLRDLIEAFPYQLHTILTDPMGTLGRPILSPATLSRRTDSKVCGSSV